MITVTDILEAAGAHTRPSNPADDILARLADAYIGGGVPAARELFITLEMPLMVAVVSAGRLRLALDALGEPV